MLSYIIIALLCVAVGVYAIMDLKALDKSDSELYENMTVPLSEMSQISTVFQRIRVNLRDLIIVESAEDIQVNLDKIQERRNDISRLSESFEKTILSDEMRKEYDAFLASRVEYEKELNKLIELAKQNRDEEAFLSVSETGGLGVASRVEQDIIAEMISMKMADAKEKADLNTKNADKAVAIMIGVIIFIVILSIFFGFCISRVISKPVKRALHMMDEMSKGHLGERLNINTRDEIGTMAIAMDHFAAELQNNAIGVMRGISDGDVSMDISIKDEHDEIAPVLKGTVETIRGLNEEVQRLIKATVEGKLGIRGNADSYQGTWKEIIMGINTLIDAFVAPINVTAEYVDRISKGDVPPKITDTYLGDFNEIKNNLNSCIDVMNGLLNETSVLIKAAKEGKLDKRADASSFSGGWEEVVNGLNQLVEVVAKPIKEVTMVMNEISQGNLDVSVKGDYQGEFDVLSQAVNNTARDLDHVVEEISDVIGQISDGNLALENITGFKGDFVNISKSVNIIIESLNSVLGDINVASDQVFTGSDQLASGSQMLSQGATEQASSVEQLTVSISQIADQTKVNANNANQAKELTLKVKDNAEKGSIHMAEMLTAMEAINECSVDISKIIKVIDEIAFQTNILALNAAVEAARAGQHGKGFAVVAEEVRNLAARSAKAAKETTEQIQNSIIKTARGTDISKDTAKALAEIVEGVTKADELVSAITTSSNEQAVGISQISLGVSQVSLVVQTNAATAEESASASEELTEQAELLKQMVGKFKLKNAGQDRGLAGKSPRDSKPLKEIKFIQRNELTSEDVPEKEAFSKY